MDNNPDKPQVNPQGGENTGRIPDGELVKSTRKGDKKAFEELINRYYNAIFGYLYLRMQDYHSAEDMTQEVFLRGYRLLRKLSKADGFADWLFTIAHHCYGEWVRDRMRSAQYKAETWKSLNQQLTKHSNHDRQPVNIMERMKELPEAYYLVLSMKYQKKMSCEDIAKSLGQPIGTVTSNLTRAYKLLWEGLNKE